MFKKCFCALIMLLVVASSITAYAWSGVGGGMTTSSSSGKNIEVSDVSLKSVSSTSYSSKFQGVFSSNVQTRVDSVKSFNEEYRNDFDRRPFSAIETGYVDTLNFVVTHDQSPQVRLAAIQGLGDIFRGEGNPAGDTGVKSVLLDIILTQGDAWHGGPYGDGSSRVDYTVEEQIAAAQAIGDIFSGQHDARAVGVCKNLVVHDNNRVDLEVKAELIDAIGDMYCSYNGYGAAKSDKISEFLDEQQEMYREDLTDAQDSLENMQRQGRGQYAVDEAQKDVNTLQRVVSAFDYAHGRLDDAADIYYDR